MKYLLLIFLGCVSFCSAQTIRFQFYRTKACSVVEKLDTNYSLTLLSPSLKDSSYKPKNGTVYLPRPGQYTIYFEGPVLDTAFDIRDTGLFVFRYKEPDHGLYNTWAVDTPPLYYRCDSLLNGYQEYHYPSGALEMRGTFNDGYPVDSIALFYRNGKTKSKLITYPKWFVYTKFDSLGNKLQIRRTQHKSYMVYREYYVEDFYPDGRLKKKESSVKRVMSIDAYYPDGKPKLRQTKKYRTEYYSNGLKSITYTWHYKIDRTTHDKDCTIRRTQYDSLGHVTRLTIYSTYDLQAQPNLCIKDSDWIISDEAYQDGKKVFAATDMDIDKYKNLYPDRVKEEGDDE
jgi:antitoxin component YwqK of YwqJK toxin-antitoxin module